jgi:hypothetical protein
MTFLLETPSRCERVIGSTGTSLQAQASADKLPLTCDYSKPSICSLPPTRRPKILRREWVISGSNRVADRLVHRAPACLGQVICSFRRLASRNKTMSTLIVAMQSFSGDFTVLHHAVHDHYTRPRFQQPRTKELQMAMTVAVTEHKILSPVSDVVECNEVDLHP